MEIKKLSPELADDYIGYMGGEAFADNADWANCYCLESHFESQWDDEPGFNSRDKARELVLAGQLVGYLAYSDDKVVGWVNANDKTAFCRLKEEWGPPELGKKVKSIVCFVIAPAQRGQGIASALLERVCSDAERDGYDYVEGYPAAGDTFDTRHYRGPASMYEKQGFTAQKEIDGGHFRELVMRKYLRELRAAQETDEERRARIYPIILSEYNPAWPEWYAEEKANLERLTGLENIVRISHYGSTSVPGLTAKPTIDILLEIDETADIDKLIAALPPPKYICLDEAALTMPTAPPHLMFIKGYLPDGFAEKVYHIHVAYPGDHDELRFRDYLIAHPETAAEYAELKRKLFRDYEHNRDGYTEAKTDFIRCVTKKARIVDSIS